jgi:hypothetical protein
MIGALYLQQLNELLSEFGGNWINIKISFDYLYEAAKDFSKETSSCHNTQIITTIANKSAYDLNPDFLEILSKDSHGKGIVALSAEHGTNWLSWESYSNYLQNDDNQPGYPSFYAVSDSSIPIRSIGTAVRDQDEIGGESMLYYSIGEVPTVFPGDSVINTTQNCYGVVLQPGMPITTAMFDLSSRGGEYSSWIENDKFIIQQQPRYQIFLDPTPNESGQIITVSYLSKPAPVYSNYGTYPFATGYEEAIVKYAAWLYKYRDSKPAMGDPLYAAYERAMRKGKNVNRKAEGVVGFRVNWTKG